MHGHNIHSLATVNYQLPRGETLFHLPLTHILEIFKDSSSTTRKYSKTFSPANLSEPQIINYSKIFKDFLGNQQQQPAAAINSSNQPQQSTAATNSSNQQQQPAAAINSSNQPAAINSSNQQQQPAATNSSNQQRQSTAAINSNNQFPSYQHHFHNPRRPTLDNISVPSTGYVLLEVDLGLAARLRVQSPLPWTIFCNIRFF